MTAVPRRPGDAGTAAPAQHKAGVRRCAASSARNGALWVDGRQVMLIQEAMGSAQWKSGKDLRTTGHPACDALALAYHHVEAVLSFGCAGMRTFTEIPDRYMLLVVPGESVEGLCRP
jgi:uncharacterized protein (DUF169 family)